MLTIFKIKLNILHSNPINIGAKIRVGQQDYCSAKILVVIMCFGYTYQKMGLHFFPKSQIITFGEISISPKVMLLFFQEF